MGGLYPSDLEGDPLSAVELALFLHRDERTVRNLARASQNPPCPWGPYPLLVDADGLPVALPDGRQVAVTSAAPKGRGRPPAGGGYRFQVVRLSASEDEQREEARLRKRWGPDVMIDPATGRRWYGFAFVDMTGRECFDSMAQQVDEWARGRATDENLQQWQQQARARIAHHQQQRECGEQARWERAQGTRPAGLRPD